MKRLVGTGAPGPETGQLLKMSKSLNNAIFLCRRRRRRAEKSHGDVHRPQAIRATDPGETDPTKNPLWAFHETFNPDTAWVDEHRQAYQNGKVGDVAVKKKLIEVLERPDRPDPRPPQAFRSSAPTT